MSLDKDKNGWISEAEFVKFLRAFNVTDDAEIQKMLVAQLDKDANGKVDYAEFLRGCITPELAGPYREFSAKPHRCAIFNSRRRPKTAGATQDQSAVAAELAELRSNETVAEALKLLAERVQLKFHSVREAFRALDADHDGVLSRAELHTGLGSKLGLDQEYPNLEAVKICRDVVTLLTGNDGHMDYVAFASMVQGVDEHGMVANRPRADQVVQTTQMMQRNGSWHGGTEEPNLPQGEMPWTGWGTRFGATPVRDAGVMRIVKGSSMFANDVDRFKTVNEAGLDGAYENEEKRAKAYNKVKLEKKRHNQQQQRLTLEQKEEKRHTTEAARYRALKDQRDAWDFKVQAGNHYHQNRLVRFGKRMQIEADHGQFKFESTHTQNLTAQLEKQQHGTLSRSGSAVEWALPGGAGGVPCDAPSGMRASFASLD
jgi:Ca2+-binding EF-hand superfamily protein